MPVNQDNRGILRRIVWVQVCLAIVFLVFAIKLWQLTILDHALYKQLAEINRVRNIPLLAPRGMIFDRNGKVLVDSIPSHNISLLREDMSDEAGTIDFLVRGLNLDRAELENRLQRFRAAPKFQPVVIKEDVTLEDIAYVRSHRRDHPEIEISEEPRRRYVYGELAAHALGYVGEITDRQLDWSEYSGYKSGDVVGQYGLERTYNRILKGIDGKRQVVVDIYGRVHQLLDEQIPMPGKEIYLTLDLDLQQVAEQEMADRAGAVVALDPRNGEILVMVSRPALDPNDFAVRISRNRWSELIKNPQKPLHNRAIQGIFSPGSVFKIIMSIAGLEQGLITPETTVFCPGGASFYGRFFRCHGVHGTVNLKAAIIYSCNVYFYFLGQRMGIDPIARTASLAGLGQPTGIDLPSEVLGVMPSQEWKKRTLKQPWYAGETISVAIGQGAVSLTPLQMARAIGGIAVGGSFPQPHLLYKVPQLPSVRPLHLKATYDPPGAALPAPEVKRVFRPENFSRVVEAMWGVVNAGGTGWRAAVTGFDVCGKTGTSQVIGYEALKRVKAGDRFADHAWFVGFAPRDNPEIVVAAMVEGGGMGGVASAPIAGKIMEAYYKKYVLPRSPALVAQAAQAHKEAVERRQ